MYCSSAVEMSKIKEMDRFYGSYNFEIKECEFADKREQKYWELDKALLNRVLSTMCSTEYAKSKQMTCFK